MRVFAAVFLLLVALPGVAADYTVRSQVDATRVGVEDQVQLTISVEGSVSLGGTGDVTLAAPKIVIANGFTVAVSGTLELQTTP